MGQVEFDEQNLDSYSIGVGDSEDKSFMVKMIERLGVPSEYVNFALIGVIIIFLSLSIYFFFFGGTTKTLPIPPSNLEINSR